MLLMVQSAFGSSVGVGPKHHLSGRRHFRVVPREFRRAPHPSSHEVQGILPTWHPARQRLLRTNSARLRNLVKWEGERDARI